MNGSEHMRASCEASSWWRQPAGHGALARANVWHWSAHLRSKEVKWVCGAVWVTRLETDQYQEKIQKVSEAEQHEENTQLIPRTKMRTFHQIISFYKSHLVEITSDQTLRIIPLVCFAPSGEEITRNPVKMHLHRCCITLRLPGCLRSREKQQPRLHCSNGTDRHSPPPPPHTACVCLRNYRNTIDGEALTRCTMEGYGGITTLCTARFPAHTHTHSCRTHSTKSAPRTNKKKPAHRRGGGGRWNMHKWVRNACRWDKSRENEEGRRASMRRKQKTTQSSSLPAQVDIWMRLCCSADTEASGGGCGSGHGREPQVLLCVSFFSLFFMSRPFVSPPSRYPCVQVNMMMMRMMMVAVRRMMMMMMAPARTHRVTVVSSSAGGERRGG